MILAELIGFMSSLLGFGGAESAVAQKSVSSVVMHEQLVVRVPVKRMPQQFTWEEHKGPRCIAGEDIRGAKLSGPQQVDFMLRDGKRVRAKFEDNCPALDFYDGFYLKLDGDELCAKRDSVHSRMGGRCRITGFRRLSAKPKD